MDVSVIIVNYNTIELTLNCINSIFTHTLGIDFEVIVVDNNSDDGSGEILRLDKRIVFIQNLANEGFGSANNIGYQYAKGKYLFLLNSDTILLNNAIKLFYDYAEQHLSSCVYGTMLLNPDNTYGHSYGKFPTILNRLGFILTLPFPNKKSEEKLFEGAFHVDYITGADMFLTRETFEKPGLFDTAFFMYYEETDLQKRMSQMGIERIIIDSPKIVHYNGGSSKRKRSNRNDFRGFESLFRYMKKHNSYMSYLSFRILSFLILFPLVFYWTGRKAKLRFLHTILTSIN